MTSTLRQTTVDQVADRLSQRFPRWSASRVRETVAEEYDLLANNPIRIYVPNLVEHEARERMRAENR